MTDQVNQTDETTTDELDPYIPDPNRPAPTAPPAGAGPGHWEAQPRYRPSDPEDSASPLVLYDMIWAWAEDPGRTEEEIRADLARQMVAASQTAQGQLNETLAPLREAIARLDPEAIRAPDGFEFAGIAFNAETELNQLRMGVANVAEAIRATAAAVEANATANEASVAATVAVLEAVPAPTAVAALAGPPDPSPALTTE